MNLQEMYGFQFVVYLADAEDITGQTTEQDNELLLQIANNHLFFDSKPTIISQIINADDAFYLSQKDRQHEDINFAINYETTDYFSKRVDERVLKQFKKSHFKSYFILFGGAHGNQIAQQQDVTINSEEIEMFRKLSILKHKISLLDGGVFAKFNRALESAMYKENMYKIIYLLKGFSFKHKITDIRNQKLTFKLIKIDELYHRFQFTVQVFCDGVNIGPNIILYSASLNNLNLTAHNHMMTIKNFLQQNFAISEEEE